MSSKITDPALFARRIEQVDDHQRMVVARRDVVKRARATVFPHVALPANDVGLEAI